MIIIGEKINSSISSAKTAMENRDSGAIRSLAKAQADAGADYIDINAGMFLEHEPEYLAFLAETVAPLGYALSIDTPSAKAAAAALRALNEKGRHLINSVTVEKGRLEGMTALAAEYGCGVVALCMQENGMPESIDSRLAVAGRLVEYLCGHGIREKDIFIDPMLRPLGADERAGTDALETIRRLRAGFPKCHISAGLSNISYGLPGRRLINRAFAVAAMTAGLDAAIADPLDRELMGQIAACEAILGIDEYCLGYIGKFRRGLIG